MSGTPSPSYCADDKLRRRNISSATVLNRRYINVSYPPKTG
jgi:hypothetical protein